VFPACSPVSSKRKNAMRITAAPAPCAQVIRSPRKAIAAATPKTGSVLRIMPAVVTGTRTIAQL
jgi:hypothetical protein